MQKHTEESVELVKDFSADGQTMHGHLIRLTLIFECGSDSLDN